MMILAVKEMRATGCRQGEETGGARKRGRILINYERKLDNSCTKYNIFAYNVCGSASSFFLLPAAFCV